jgi:hypothetical protein
MVTPVRLLDPLRVVDGTRGGRYDCPDLATLDRQLDHLRRRIASPDSRVPHVADGHRADIDRLLDRRIWLTLRALPASPGARQPAG